MQCQAIARNIEKKTRKTRETFLDKPLPHAAGIIGILRCIRIIGSSGKIISPDFPQPASSELLALAEKSYHYICLFPLGGVSDIGFCGNIALSIDRHRHKPLTTRQSCATLLSLPDGLRQALHLLHLNHRRVPCESTARTSGMSYDIAHVCV